MYYKISTFYFILIFLLFFTSCQKESIYSDAELAYELVNDENDLSLEEIEADSRSARHRIFEVVTENYVPEDDINCYQKYNKGNYATLFFNDENEFTIIGEGFGEEQGTSEIVASNVRELFTSDVVSWTDTEITVRVFNHDHTLKNFRLKFKVTIDDNYRIKTILAVGAFKDATIDGNNNGGIMAYPCSAWETNKVRLDFEQELVFTSSSTNNYNPILGDMLIAGNRAAVVVQVQPELDKDGFSQFRVHERNRNCRGRLARNKIYKLKDGVIQQREAESSIFEILFR